jgi:transposase
VTLAYLKGKDAESEEAQEREIVVANAQQVKKVPGRKTDVKDAEWIAALLCHGLLRSSFIPPKPIRQLRDLTCYRRKLVESRSAERNRLLKLLESANIKLASVASDVFGVSGQLMLRALIAAKATATANG